MRGWGDGALDNTVAANTAQSKTETDPLDPPMGIPGVYMYLLFPEQNV